jgi:dihydrofolate reductase
VASSLDGYIAGPHGEFDWIVVDPDIDFAAMYAGFSGLVMGRRSYECTSRPEEQKAFPCLRTSTHTRFLRENATA